MRRAPTAEARRLRAILLAGLLIASQGSSWLHAAVVSHVTCLEHGETIHAGAYQPDETPSPVDPAARQLRADDAAGAGHEHCASGALLRWRDVVLATPMATAPIPVLVACSLLDSSRGFGVGRARYLVAPKTSPPSTVV